MCASKFSVRLKHNWVSVGSLAEITNLDVETAACVTCFVLSCFSGTVGSAVCIYKAYDVRLSSQKKELPT